MRHKKRGGPNPLKKNSKSCSFYDDFAKKLNPEQQLKVQETPEGLLEYVNAAGDVVGRQLPPEKIIRRAEERGITVEQALQEAATNHVSEKILEHIRIRLCLPSKPSLHDPVVRRMFSDIQQNGYYPYNEETAQQIANRFASGERFSEFLGKGNFPPYGQYVRWKSRYPEFRKMMEEAMRQRAERYIAELEHVADKVDNSNAKAAKVRGDILKHLAAVHDPEQYGHRTKVVGDKNQPLAFTVVTGVPPSEAKSEDGPALVGPTEEDDEL